MTYFFFFFPGGQPRDNRGEGLVHWATGGELQLHVTSYSALSPLLIGTYVMSTLFIKM